MEPIQLFQLASKQAQWLSVRESVVSTNVANANTPGFRTKDVVPFSQYLDASASESSNSLGLVSTNPAHFGDAASLLTADVREVDDGKSNKISSSGNNVGLAQEMMKSNEIRQEYDLNTSLVKSINRMMMMVVRK